MQRSTVVIVGGRVAGSSLAIQLGHQGIDVLLVDRAKFPSPPAASSPLIFSPVMSMLDELGANESAYAYQTPRLHHFIVEGDGQFFVQHDIPEAQGRNYAYAIERARFDAELWRVASEAPNVTAYDEVFMLGLLQSQDRVTGVTLKDHNSNETFDVSADIVVGADGRYSRVAREVEATPHHVHTQFPTSVYYASWRGVQRVADEPVIHLFRGQAPYGLLILDSADETTTIVLEGRPGWIESRGRPEQVYRDALMSHAPLRARLSEAEQVSPVRGIRRVPNLFRQGGGPGWALVGDAFHQKDPLDGQGIYNALVGSRELAEAIATYLNGASWQDAVTNYEDAVFNEVYPMYQVTMGRVLREVYPQLPIWAGRTVGKWVFTDPTYLNRWIRLLIRDIPADEWLSTSVILRAVLSGAISDIRKLIRP